MLLLFIGDSVDNSYRVCLIPPETELAPPPLNCHKQDDTPESGLAEYLLVPRKHITILFQNQAPLNMSTYFLTIAEIAVGSFYTIHSFVTEQRDKEMPKSIPPAGWIQGYQL